jgi:hypothetical protein
VLGKAKDRTAGCDVDRGNTGSEEAHERCRTDTRNGLCKTQCSAGAGEGVVLVLERAAVIDTIARGDNNRPRATGDVQQWLRNRQRLLVLMPVLLVLLVLRSSEDSLFEDSFALRAEGPGEIWRQAAASLECFAGSNNLRLGSRAAGTVAGGGCGGGGAARDTAHAADVQ